MASNHHFLDTPLESAHSPGSPYVFLPVPWEHTTSFGQGTARGPAALLRASHEIDTVDEELLLPINMGVQTLPPLKLTGRKPDNAMKIILQAASAVHSQNRFLLAAGGEHSISAPLIEAASRKYKDLSVLQFDAHLDLRDSYSGTKHSHASVMRRVTDLKIPVVHAGIRSICAEELALLKASNPPVFFARDMIGTSPKTIAKQICSRLTKDVYITFDVDALDPSVMPGTGTPEPGGLNWQMTTAILREIIKRRNVVAADVVELAPIKGSNVSEYAAARLAQKIITYHHYRKKL